MIDYMYHPGDRVRVRPDLSTDKYYKMLSGIYKDESWHIFYWMKKYAGQEIVIQEIDAGVYKAQGINGCIWVDEMFEDTLDECVCSSLL